MSLYKNLNHNNSPAVFISCPHKYIINNQEVTVGQDEEKEMPPLAPLLLLGKLKQYELNCDFLDWSSFSNHDINEIAIIASHYSIIFTSANSINWGIVNTLAKKIKQHNRACKICVGGPHPSIYHQSISKKDHFDYIVSGEADDEIVSIYKAITETSHSNIAQKTRIIPAITDLNKLENHIAYDLIPPNLYESIPIESSRGCKYSCSFCSILSHKNWRSYNVSKTIQQLQIAFNFMEEKSCNTIQIIDNSFTSNNKRAIEICTNLSHDKFANRLSYDSTIADLQNKELISTLSIFTKHILVGAEITSTTLAKKIKKPITPNSIKKAAQNLYQFNISHKSVFSFIIGFPWQTKNDCLQTIEFASDLILSYGINALIQWYWPIPGSKIWRELEEKKKINIEMIDTPTTQNAVNLFFKSTPLNKKEIVTIEDKINPINLCLMLNNKHFGKPKLKLTNSPLKLQMLKGI